MSKIEKHLIFTLTHMSSSGMSWVEIENELDLQHKSLEIGAGIQIWRKAELGCINTSRKYRN
jgi:hypothetical protein